MPSSSPTGVPRRPRTPELAFLLCGGAGCAYACHKSSQLIARGARAQEIPDSPHRACPSCGTALEWLECAVLDGLEYDYYRWCRNGCGLYSYQRAARPGSHCVELA